MAVFSTNQNRHLYVATALGASSHKPSLTNPGDIGVGSIGSGDDKQMFFEYMNKKGEVIKSDYIPLKNLEYVKPVKASDMEQKLKKVELTLASGVNSGAPVAGQDYVLRIAFRQFYGMSDEDQYYKDCAVHATSGMSASDFYKAMLNALNLAFSREVGATKTSNPYLAFSVDNTTTATKLIIEEKPQDWTLGIGSQERVYFDVVPTTIYSGGDDVIWGTPTDVTASNTNVLKNGKQIADLEWFCMGERGDQYRYQGWPNYIPTDYMVDATKDYSVIELHFAFTDTGVNSYRSEKDITIAVPNGTSTAKYTAVNAIIDEIEYHSGLTIAGLADS